MWFAFLSYPKFDDRPLFNPGALCLICAVLNSQKVFLRDSNDFAKPNNTEFTFMLKKKKKKKKKKKTSRKFFLLSSKTFPLFMNDLRIRTHRYVKVIL